MYAFNKDYKFSIDGCNIIEAKKGSTLNLPDAVVKRLLLKSVIGEVETQEVKVAPKRTRKGKK